MYPFLLFALFFQTPSPKVALLSNCAEPEHAVGTLQAASVVHVRSAMAGGPETCYAVTAIVDGKPVEGYILGEKLPAIADFERQHREAALAAQARAAEQARLAAEARAAAEVLAAAAAAPQEKPHRPVFGDFSAIDLKGRSVRLSDLKGKAVVICFWSPSSTTSIRELVALSKPFLKLHKDGLDVIAVSLDAGQDDIEDALEGSTPFPDIPDRFGIATRHGVDSASIPRTFILDKRHEIVAAGLHGAALQNTISETLKNE